MVTTKTISEYKYLRANKKFPSVWCAGCGAGIVMGAIIRAIDRLGISKDDVTVVSGIGCTARMPVYMDFNTLHTTHGRALAFATGIKLAKPGMKVIVVMGDGDALAIGGNHFIHTARRNMDLVAIVANNSVYGMTGGQFSPTTPTGDLGTTTPYGNIEQDIDTCKLAETAGATFVARTTAYHVFELERFILQALKHEGFSMIEVLSPCPTEYGRRNKLDTPVELIEHLRDITVPVGKEVPPGKFSRGILVNRKQPGYIRRYAELVDSVGGTWRY